MGDDSRRDLVPKGVALSPFELLLHTPVPCINRRFP
jgi:hypothetical protein